MSCFRIYIYLLILFIITLGFSNALAEEHFTRGNVAFDYGVWKPSALDQNSSKPFDNIKGADNYMGVSLTSPSIKSYAIRLAFMYWKQNELEDIELDYVSLRHLSVELKNYILTQSRICPFVNYGIAGIWSRQVPMGADNSNIPLDRAGFGFNVGTGVNLYLFSRFAFTAEYAYLYAKFSQKVGETDNYSGPKLSFKLNFLF